ncbi:MAG: F0F1 ATP synthase subunit A [Planctomycetes bacterium]|nr:F0F1 ATP synthase subunit A [Planctomycetota bacterium]MBI3833014.1 F0F1 ATP synthase subunit A [Planctomycetota bacterium]
MNKFLLASSNPMDHVYQWVYKRADIGTSNSVFTPDGTISLISNHIAMQIIAVLLLILLIPIWARVRTSGDAVRDMTPSGFGNFIETLCAYLRETVARPVLGEYTDRFIPYIWTAFFYILFINLLGLLPLEPLTRGLVKSVFPNAHHGIGGSATGNIWVTGTLAGCTFFMIVFNGLRYNGMDFVKHFFQGPVFIAPMIAVLEVIGLCAKCFALTVRLFANMVAGHVLLAVLLSFISLSYVALGTGAAAGIGITVVLVSVAFNLLEIFVAFLQAFIFTFLTTLFIGQAVVIHHEHHDDHGHEHEHGHGQPAHATAGQH